MKKIRDKNKFNFWPYFKKHKCIISIFLILLLIDIGVQTFVGIYGALILADISTGLYILAIKKFIIQLVVLLIANIAQHIRNCIYFKVSNSITNEMRVDIATQAFKISDKSYSDHKTSNFTQRISGDPATIFNTVYRYIMYIQSIITAIIMVVYISLKSWTIGILTIVSVGIIMTIERIRKKIYKKNKREKLKRDEKASSLLNEIVRSEKDIKSLNLEQELRQRVKQLTDNCAEQNIKTEIINRNYFTTRKIIINILITAILVIGLWQTHIGFLTLGSFMVIYTNRFEIGYLSDLLSDFTDFSTDISLAVSRVSELYEDDEYELEKFGSKSLKNIKGKIEFKNVNFAYSEYKEKTDEEIKAEIKENKKKKIKAKVKSRIETGKKPVLNKMNFVIEPNTTVSFVGVSGSGKSTILNLISKMYEVDGGKVLIDGVDIKSLNKETLRSAISLVNQFPYIFDMTIKENLILAKPDATDEEINLAIKESALEDFIAELPQGVDTYVGEGGIKLSGGQKQRVAIARAMLRKSPIIIFDESTSSLDNISQNQIKKSIDNIKGKSTIVIVAHRLSTIKNVDKIYFLENGEIADSGTFSELYKNNKKFKHIFNAENIEN